MVTTVWKIANPTYMRSSDADGQIPFYSFRIVSGAEYNEKLMNTKAQLQSADIVSLYTPALLQTYLLELYSHFLTIHKHRFAKPYTPAQLIKVTHHTFLFDKVMETGEREESQVASLETPPEVYEWSSVGSEIQVRGGAFHLLWTMIGKPVHIELNVTEAETEYTVNTITNDNEPKEVLIDEQLNEVSLDELPAAEDDVVFRPRIIQNQPNDEERLKGRQQVEEARIRAKWAHYKAEKALAKYIERYGEYDDFLSSSSDDDFSSSSDETEKSS